MAANIFKSGTGNATITFDRAVDYINIFVAASITCTLSVDNVGFMTIPSGLNSFRIGPTFNLYIQSTGAWQLIAIQA
jgi:hypothetical protein